ELGDMEDYEFVANTFQNQGYSHLTLLF
ncbi:MAG: hypothetical protein RIS29_3045, partial [Bacteroidota bacterium]